MDGAYYKEINGRLKLCFQICEDCENKDICLSYSPLGKKEVCPVGDYVEKEVELEEE